MGSYPSMAGTELSVFVKILGVFSLPRIVMLWLISPMLKNGQVHFSSLYLISNRNLWELNVLQWAHPRVKIVATLYDLHFFFIDLVRFLSSTLYASKASFWMSYYSMSLKLQNFEIFFSELLTGKGNPNAEFFYIYTFLGIIVILK